MALLRRQIRFRHIRLFLSWPVLLLLALSPADAGQKPAPSQDPLVRMNESIDALTRKVWPSVVQILVSSYGAREGGDRRRGQCRRRQTAARPVRASSSIRTATS